MKFALYFGNRGFMPAELIEGAREDMVKAVTNAGYEYIMMDKDATRYGAVETRDEGRLYAKWLKSHEGEYDGVILCMPIFVVEMARKHGASVEAEIGSMGAREGGGSGGESIYTDPDDAKDFAEKTGIDALACAFGTAHGLYAKEPKLDFQRLKRIGELVSVPLVMHGGSGVNPADYMKSIELGIRKINCYTYMAKAGGTAVDGLKKDMLYHDIELAATQAMREDASKSIGFFSMPKSPEYSKYTGFSDEQVGDIVRKVLENINK